MSLTTPAMVQAESLTHAMRNVLESIACAGHAAIAVKNAFNLV